MGEQKTDSQKTDTSKPLNSKEIQKIIDTKMNQERKKWEERLRNIHAKQLQELKKKIKDWMKYAKEQEHHAKIYKKQLQIQHSKSSKKNVKKNNNMTQPKQLYHTGTLSRAQKNAIPEAQEINQNDDV